MSSLEKNKEIWEWRTLSFPEIKDLALYVVRRLDGAWKVHKGVLDLSADVTIKTRLPDRGKYQGRGKYRTNINSCIQHLTHHFPWFLDDIYYEESEDITLICFEFKDRGPLAKLVRGDSL